MVKYYFVRHGESTANVNKVFAGWSDVELTKNGIKQAEELADRIKRSGTMFDVIISSSLKRALDTAKIIANTISYPPEKILVMDNLREKCGGSLELKPREYIYSKTEKQIIEEYGGEDARLFMARIKRALKRVMKMTDNVDSVLIVAHSGIYKVAKVIADEKDEDPTEIYKVEIPENASLLEFPIQSLDAISKK